MPKVIFESPEGVRREIEAAAGLSVMEVARMHDFPIEGTCEGSMACATCHVIVAPEHAAWLGEPCAEEEDMLDLAVGLEATSRLGCQIVLSDALDGLTVRIPRQF
jgi:2Fe-2S ferredoxin